MDEKMPGTKSSEKTTPSSDRRISGTVRLSPKPDAAGIDQKVNNLTCPVCRLKNPEGEAYCAECGFQLGTQLEGAPPLQNAHDLARAPHLEDSDGHSFPLKPGVNTVGREGTDIVIVDRSVSRYHGIIVFDEERNIFSIEDTDSTNGSVVNGEALPAHHPLALHNGDQVAFGNVTFRFVLEGNRVPGMQSIPPALSEPTLPTGAKREELIGEPAGRLTLLRGNGPREILLEQGANTMGRHPDNKICLSEDRYVSGHHARIDVEGDLFLLLDMGSTNGTFLNGLRLTTNAAIAIGEGDEVMIGGLLLQFHKLDSPPAEDGLDKTLLGAPSLDQLSAGYVGDGGPELDV